MFKHPLAVLLGTSCPGVSDFPDNFLSDATLGTDGNVSLQAVKWMVFMTFGIAFQIVVFHMRLCDGLNPLGGSIARCVISGNKPALIWPEGCDHDQVLFPF